MKKSVLFALLCLLGFGAARTAQAADEIYAVLEGTTTTFYYDSHKEMRGGARYWEMSWSSEKSKYLNNTETVFFDSSMDNARPTSTRSWFSSFEKLEEIVDIRYLHTDEVTDMTEMFAHCRALKEIDVSGFNTSNVTSMNAMFMYCDKLTYINITNFDVSKVKDISRIFAFDEALTVILCSQDWTEYSFDDSNYMFMSCTSLIGGDGTEYDEAHIGLDYARADGWEGMPGYFTEETTYVYYVYEEDTKVLTYYYDNKMASREGLWLYYDSEKEEETLGSWSSLPEKAIIDKSMKHAKMPTMKRMFYGLSGITEIEGMQYLYTSSVTDMSQMFYGCASLTSIDLSNFNTANVTDMSVMFRGCKALTSLDLSSFNTDNVTTMRQMFLGCSQLTALDLSPLNTANVTDMSYMFRELQLTSIDLSPLNTDNVTNMAGMFMGCSQLTSLDLSPLNTANVTDMSSMFSGCSQLTSLDLSPLNTANVTNMSSMFSGCSQLTSLDLNPLITDNATNMSAMFRKLQLTSIDLSPLNTDNVTDMSYMFSGCSELTSLDLSALNSVNVTNMEYMFSECTQLTSLDLSPLNTAKVEKMTNMFDGCVGLTSLDLRSFTIDLYTNTNRMFLGCSALKTIYCNDAWKGGEGGAKMFLDCVSLVGGNGTTYDESKVDAGYARPDDPENGKPGYFTAANTHAVTLIAENGTISVEEDVDLGAVPYGTTLHLTATPNAGCEFVGWTNYDPETGLKVMSDTTVTATFNLTATYRVTAVSADDALGEVTLVFDGKDVISKGEDENDYTVVPDAVGHLVATPKDKYTEFVRWNDEAEGFTLAERDITVTGDFDYIAQFKKDSFNVVVEVEGIDPALVKVHGAGKYGRGDNATVSFTLNDDHYDFDMYLFDENNFRKTETLQFEEMDDNHDVRIVFKAKYYNVSATVIPAEAGIVKGQGDYEYGTDYTLTLEPAEGWELKEWRDGEALDEKSNVLTGYVYGEIHIECVLQKKEATALDAAEGTTGSAARKLLRNGILLIERNGTTYTVHGAALK